MRNKDFILIKIAIVILMLGFVFHDVFAAIIVQRAADIYAGANSAYPQWMVVFNNQLYFAANGGDGTGNELWVYDGTNAPSRVADIRPGTNSSNPQHLTVYHNKLYFAADGGIVGNEFWVYDGLNAPIQVADIAPGISGSDPQYLTILNGKLYFTANGNDGAGIELWVFDGLNTPSRAVDIYPGASSSYPQYLAVFNSKLYFAANGGDGTGNELWAYDGINIPSRVADIRPGASSSYPRYLEVFNSKLYFAANGGNGTAGRELWVYDGNNVPSRIADIWPGVDGSDPQFLRVFNNKQYFAANGGDGAGAELWMYDGSNPPSRAADIYSGSNSSSPSFLAYFNNRLYFQANGGDGAGAELWNFIEDSTPPTVTVTDPINNATITPTNTLEVTFSEDMTHDGDTGAADYANNYLLVEGKGNGFQTTACNATDFVNDTRININSATYDNNGGAGPFKATLGINNGNPLPNGSYRLFICGTTSVTDLAGNKINGGADSVVSFTVSSLTTLPVLPQTGFAPGVITQVGSQSLGKAYQDMGCLTLEIPALSIKAPIVGVPRTSQGWELSWLGNKAGWLEGTSFPTWAGNSALTAHVVDSNGQPGLFADLGKLSYGKEIVISAWGQRHVYQVRSVKAAVNPEDVSAFKHKDYPYLTLITCKGFDEKSNSYRWRVVVQAVQVRVE